MTNRVLRATVRLFILLRLEQRLKLVGITVIQRQFIMMKQTNVAH